MRLTNFKGNSEINLPKFHPMSVAGSSNLFKYLPPPLSRRRKKFPSSPFDFIHMYKGEKKKKKKSWMDMINPFECETDYDDDEDFSDYSGSSEFMRRKSKHKNNKLKKKKKKILIKFVIGFLIFVALKILFDKLIYLFPGVFPTTGRLELAPNEVDHLYDEAPPKSVNLEETFFSPTYDETHIIDTR